MSEKPKGEYGLTGENLRNPRTRVKTGPQPVPGAPLAQILEGTPIQPIVIQVPAPPRERESSGPKTAARGPDVWSLVAAVLVAVILSGLLSVYVASKFLEEYTGKIERLDKRVDALDGKLRVLGNTTTKIETQIENDDDPLPERVDRLNRKLRTLETTMTRLEATLGRGNKQP